MYYINNGLQEDTVIPLPPHHITNIFKCVPACFHGHQMVQNLLEEVKSDFNFSGRKIIGESHTHTLQSLRHFSAVTLLVRWAWSYSLASSLQK